MKQRTTVLRCTTVVRLVSQRDSPTGQLEIEWCGAPTARYWLGHPRCVHCYGHRWDPVLGTAFGFAVVFATVALGLALSGELWR